MNNATKQQWYPVECIDSGRATDFIIMEGNPINGTFIGCYADLGTAFYVATLHNNHWSSHPILREVDLMYQSEIHFGLIGFWDGGISWYLGLLGDDGLKGVDENKRGNEPTVEEALAAVTRAARRCYPDSTFARIYGGDVVVNPDQRSIEDLAAELRAKGTSFSLDFDATITDPYECPWTVALFTSPAWAEPQELAYQGYTADEALREALAYQGAT